MTAKEIIHTIIHTDWDAVILGNGDYPVHSLPLGILQQPNYLVCCDGAANELLRHGLNPDVIIGDGDSLLPENKDRFLHIFHQVINTETNDQTKAVHFLLKQGKKKIVLIGATGKREDHTLGNISLLMDYQKEGAEVWMATDYGVFIPANDTSTFPCYAGQQISIFNFGATNLEGEGLAYPLSDFTNWWQGTLNEATGEEFTIRATGSYLVFLAH